MTEAELIAIGQKFIEESLFSPRRTVEPTPEYDMIVEDVFTGLRGTWTVHFDVEEVAAQPDDDWRTVTRALLRYVELDGPEYQRPLRFSLSQIDAVTLSILQDLADEEVRCME